MISIPGWCAVVPALILSPVLLSASNAGAEEPYPHLEARPSRKTAGAMLTAEMRANAVRNAERYEWAAKLRDAYVRSAKSWVSMSDEELWHLPMSQEMPRDNSVNRTGDGCPKCGKEHFKAPYSPSRWLIDRRTRPFQVQCRNCGQWFPTNDFASYYQSGLDEHGFFHLGKGDPKYLKPTQNGGNPAWVDDGTGIEVDGKKWHAAAGYSARLWQNTLKGVRYLARAYTVTNDPVYAHKAGVLLDRIADMYPDMDFLPHFKRGMEFSSGGSGRGRIQGQIWENGTAVMLTEAYDSVYDAIVHDDELVAFSSGMSRKYRLGDKSTSKKLIDHIETNLIKEFIEAMLKDQIVGNVGFQQRTMTTVAIALDDPEITSYYLDWVFRPDGGKLPYIMRELLCRDGLSHEGSIGYSAIPGKSFGEVAWRLRQYDKYDRHDLYRDYPKFRSCFLMGASVRAADRAYPNWGDANKCMNMGRGGLTLSPEMALQGYRIYGGHEMAREVWYASSRDLKRLRLDIFEKEPEAILASLKQDLKDELAGEDRELASFNTGGYGCAFLESGKWDTARSVMLYYGRMIKHGHEDRLAIQMIANDAWVIPDLGYPLYTGPFPKRMGWTSHVVSHNTVMVNDKGPKRDGSWSGRTRLFDEAKPVAVADIDGEGPRIYDGVRTYARCLVMVDVDDAHSYLVDVFRVRGGSNHRLIQNAGGPEAETSGLQFTEQKKGTYAGENVPFGEFYDGKVGWRYDGTGFMFLRDVARAKTDKPFWTDWKIVEPRRKMPETWQPHVRVHNLTTVDEVALCTGEPPLHKGNPPELRYLLRTRFGDNLETQFLSVIEPYNGAPFIREVRALENGIGAEPGKARAAVEVLLADGRRDVILVSEEPASMKAGDVSMQGRIGFVRFGSDGKACVARLFEGTHLEGAAARIDSGQRAWTGKLLRFDTSDVANTRLILDADVPEGIEGRLVIFDNKERSDASYRILRREDARTLNIGPTSLVERFVDEKDYGKGVVYNIAPGDRFRVANGGEWDAGRAKKETK